MTRTESSVHLSPTPPSWEDSCPIPKTVHFWAFWSLTPGRQPPDLFSSLHLRYSDETVPGLPVSDVFQQERFTHPQIGHLQPRVRPSPLRTETRGVGGTLSPSHDFSHGLAQSWT